MASDDSPSSKDTVAQAQAFLEEFAARAETGAPRDSDSSLGDASNQLDAAYEEIGVALQQSSDMGELQQAAQRVLTGYLDGLREEGRADGLRESLRLVYTARFGPPSDKLRARLDAMVDHGELAALVPLYATADESDL
jgi:hypothetical protein